MHIRPLILPLICVGAFTPFLSRADGEDTSAPPGYVWFDLSHFNGRVLIPTGWFCREIRGPDETGYQMTKEEVVPKKDDPLTANANKHIDWSTNRISKGADYLTGFTIKVISGRLWNESRLSNLAGGVYEDRKRECLFRGGRVSELRVSSIGTYTTREYNLEIVETIGNVVETQRFVEQILLDTKTPTMILVTFDCPLSAWLENRDCCERFFATLSMFQGAKLANRSPYSPNAPATTAAAEAAAQTKAAVHESVGMQQSVPDRTVFRMRGPP
jgi:hypothetical protein